MNLHKSWNIQVNFIVHGEDVGITVPICTRWDCGVEARIRRRADVRPKMDEAFALALKECRRTLAAREKTPLAGSTLEKDTGYRAALQRHIRMLEQGIPVYVGHPLDYTR